MHEGGIPFSTPDYDEWNKRTREAAILSADDKVKKINQMICDAIFSKFRELYGDDRNEYWEKGIKDKDLKTKAYQRSLDDPVETRLPPESYLDVLDYKKIAEKAEKLAPSQRRT